MGGSPRQRRLALPRRGWRPPRRVAAVQVFAPYVVLFLAAAMFYWWPLGRIRRGPWFAYIALFVVGTMLNLASHG